MGLKRIIAPEGFNKIKDCYFEDFVTHGHLPVYVEAEYNKQNDSKITKTDINIPRAIQKTLTCRGPFYIIKQTNIIERSPRLHLNFVSADLWDAAINKICATWGKETIVKQMISKNRETMNVILWKKAHTENGNRGSQLVLSSVDDVPWSECHYKTQRAAAGELWVDTCEYDTKERTAFVSTCRVGSHTA